MTRFFASTFFSVIFTFLMLGAAAGPALAGPAHYRAQPATAPAAERVVVRDLLWKCGPEGCVAGRSASRPAIACAALARQVGSLRSFSTGGRPLAAAELEKCNARAR